MKTKFSGYTQAILCALITFTVGMSYGAYGMLLVPLSERLGCSIAAAGIPATVETVAGFVVGLIGGGKLIEKWTARRCVLIGALIACLFVSSYIYLPSLGLLCVWEAITGASMAFGYTNGMSAFISNWFVSRREQVLGIAIAANSFGAAAGNWLFGMVDTNFGIDVTCGVFAALGVVAFLIYTFLLRNPEQINQKPLGYEEATKLAAAEGNSEETVKFGIDFKDALKTPALYMLMGSCLLWGLCMVVSPYLATIMMTNGVEEMSAANFASINNLTTAVTAIGIGTLTSKLGPKSYVIVAFGSGILGLSALAMWLEVSRNSATLLLASVLLGAGYVVGSTYGPMMATKTFGNKCYEYIINMIFAMRCIGLGVGLVLIPGLSEKLGTWFPSVILGIAMLLGAIVLGLLAVALSPMKKMHKN